MQGAVIYVKDASRSVGVCQQLVTQSSARRVHRLMPRRSMSGAANSTATRAPRRRSCRLPQARARKFKIDWADYVPPVPSFLGVRAFDDYPLAELRALHRLDAVLQCLGIRRQISRIFLQDAVVGEAASGLYADATRMLEQLIEEKWLQGPRRGRILSRPTASATMTSRCTPTSRGRLSKRACIICGSRNPSRRISRNLCLADFVAPIGSGRADYIGAFAVTAGIGIDEHVARFEAAHDDYSSIMLKALADRLAEALAERMHERVRRELWGYAPQERLDGTALIREEYQGIRPAPGYPACPDHTEKATLWQLLDPQNATPASA